MTTRYVTKDGDWAQPRPMTWANSVLVEYSKDKPQ